MLIGNIQHNDIKIYIEQSTFDGIEALSLSNTEKELGSILLGDYVKGDNEVISVIISDFIEAKYTDASASTLTFTHETWDYVYKEQTERYADKKIVGWQHTHPSYGIFLSGYDLFIHENFFNSPFQIAYVVDPINKRRGFFQWQNGKIEDVKGYYLFAEEGTQIKLSDQKNMESGSSQPRTRLHTSQNVLMGILSVVALVSIVLVLVTGNNFSKFVSYQEEVINQINSILDAQDEKLSDIDNTISDAINVGSDDKGDEESGSNSEDKNSYVVFEQYLIKSGDTLQSICDEHGLDYTTQADVIKNVNGIENSNLILAGEYLLLPISIDIEK
jgi:proteasome lid subunit RPN8/RPN11